MLERCIACKAGWSQQNSSLYPAELFCCLNEPSRVPFRLVRLREASGVLRQKLSTNVMKVIPVSQPFALRPSKGSCRVLPQSAVEKDRTHFLAFGIA
jgi:hypothetical protein